MKILIRLFFFCLTNAFASFGFSQLRQTTKPDFRNFYGIVWSGTPHTNLAYAKQMGYDYVFYQKGMELDSLSNGLHFYLETPEYFLYEGIIDTKKVYSAKEKSFYEEYCSLKYSNDSFPFNIATGWQWQPETNKFRALLDFQQQKIISWAIHGILTFVKSIEARNPKFHFGGYAWDEPRLAGDFWSVSDGKGVPVSLTKWNGGDYGFIRNAKNIIHNYPTYTYGHVEFYKQLYKVTRLKFYNARFISEPYNLYEGWIKVVKNLSYAKEITPDILSQEGPGTGFVDDDRIYASRLIKKENVYCTTPDVFDEENNRIVMAKAAINGAGFGWFGRFGGTGNMPDFKNIKEVPPRLKLIRMISNWENRNGTFLSARRWNGSVYQSKNAFASADVISALQPGTKRLFVVFLTLQGSLTISGKQKVVGIFRTDDLFIENNNGEDDFNVTQSSIKPRNTNCLNKGYIVQLNQTF